MNTKPKSKEKAVKKTKKQSTRQDFVEKELKNQLEDLRYVARMVFSDIYSMTSRKWQAVK
jgi:hypothetical protein